MSNLILNNQTFDFSRFANAEMVASFYPDKLFSNTKQVFIDNFGNNRQLNWNVRVEQDDVWKTVVRKSDTQLKYTGISLPYILDSYKNENVLKYTDKFEFVNANAFSGSTTTDKTVGIGDNHGAAPFMYLTDVSSSVFEIEVKFIFDKSIIDGDLLKKFELILKGEEHFSTQNNNFGITDYYFVGPGVYNFDVGLGMRSIDVETGEVKETFLASWGDFNVRNIKADVWYVLKAQVSPTYIKIFFNEEEEDPQLILSYNIDKRNEKITDRYLKGEFENLQALIIGLEDLGITYPSSLGNTVSSDFTFKNFKEEFASTLPVNGFYSGFRLSNDQTYVANVKYGVQENKIYTFGAAYDSSSQDDLITSIKEDFAIVGDVVKVRKTLNLYTLIQIDDSLFYQFDKNTPVKYDKSIEQFEVSGDKTIVVEKVVPRDCLNGLVSISGSNAMVWSYSSNTTGIKTLSDFALQVPHLEKMTITRDGTEIASFPSTSGGLDPIILIDDVIEIIIEDGKTSMFPLSGTFGRYERFVRVYQEGFSAEYPVLIKDKTFYNDNLKSYMDFSHKIINQVVINDNRLHIIFKDY